MDSKEALPKAAEFFAGIGLVRRALEHPRSKFRWETIYANDNDPKKHRIYQSLFPDAPSVLDKRDIGDVQPQNIPACDLWTISFPCTDVSLAGNRGGIRANQSAAVWKVLSLLKEIPRNRTPRVLLLENVVGLLSSNDGRDFGFLIKALNEHGYGVDPLRIDARHFVPQSRQRLFLIATKLDANSPEEIDPHDIAPSEVRPQILLNAMRMHQKYIWHARPLPSIRSRAVKVDSVLEPLPLDDERWWDSGRTKHFYNQIHPRHLPAVKEALSSKDISYFTAFRRVRVIDGTKRCVAEIRRDGIAGCLRTPKGGSAKQIVVRASSEGLSVRHLTPFECMQLQGWKKRPDPSIDTDDMLFALGDAVCVPAVRWVLENAVGHPNSNAPRPSKSSRSSKNDNGRSSSRTRRVAVKLA